ncbi:MAG: prolipoprotein diacylglyceryl transferase [Proteobacteria bacterium]|nr:prolipoprotein diacylglyceryl transferase [Pseudomonadota bacterium]
MHYPVIDPIIVSLGPIALRWYGLMYLLGFAAVYLLGQWRINNRPNTLNARWDAEQLSDLVFYGAMGAVLGGRVGYVIFYGFERLAADPLYLFRVWEGGMSFHGGFLGVLVAMAMFGRRHNKDFLTVTDFLAPLCPVGLGLGRLGNFINMELPGRVTESGLGLVFQCRAVSELNAMCFGVWESVARHPSSVYQAATEGLLLFAMLWLLALKPSAKGVLSGVFLLGYGSFRFLTEFLRSPDAHIGFVLFEFISMGQLLSLPMVLAGIWLVRRAAIAATAGNKPAG